MRRVWLVLATWLLVFGVGTSRGFSLQGKAAGAAQEAAISTADLVQPADLAAELRGGQKVLVLQVGSHVLFAEAHVPGALYAGPAGKADGLDALRTRVAGMGKDQPIVLYCGCCPWAKCPNIRPAYGALKQLGFTNVKALYLPTDFGTDWVKMGYPVEQGR